MVKTFEDRVVNSVVYVILALVAVVSVFPLMYVVAVSLTPYDGERIGGIVPRSISFEAYTDL